MIWSGKLRRNQKSPGAKQKGISRMFSQTPREQLSSGFSYSSKGMPTPFRTYPSSSWFLPYVKMTTILLSGQTNTSPFKSALTKCQRGRQEQFATKLNVGTVRRKTLNFPHQHLITCQNLNKSHWYLALKACCKGEKKKTACVYNVSLGLRKKGGGSWKGTALELLKLSNQQSDISHA